MNPPNWLNRLWLATLAVHLALIAGLVALIGTSADRGGWMAALAVLPLLLPLPGLIKRLPRTAAWASMLVAFYCALLLADVYMHPTQRAPLIALSCLSALDYLLLMLWTKAAAKSAKRA